MKKGYLDLLYVSILCLFQHKIDEDINECDFNEKKKKKSKRNKKMKILMQNQYFTDSCGVTSWLASNMSQN